MIDPVTNYPGVGTVLGNALPPGVFMPPVQTFRRIKKDSSEDLEFFLGQTSITTAPSIINNFIENNVKDFFAPGRYEHTIELTHANSACYIIEEKFIYDFVFEDQSFVIDINERFFLGEKLSFTLKNFVTREPDDMLTRLHITYCYPPFDSNTVDQIDCTNFRKNLEFHYMINVYNNVFL